MSETTQAADAFDNLPENMPFMPPPVRAEPGAAPEDLLGRRVALARAHYKLSAEALSRLSKLIDKAGGRGVSPPSISRYESGESLPGARELRLLCESLAVSPEWLLYGEPPQPRIDLNDDERALVLAVRGMAKRAAKATVNDFEIGGSPVSSIIEFQRQAERVRLLTDARKPT